MLMTWKLCAAWMRHAIMRNHLNKNADMASFWKKWKEIPSHISFGFTFTYRKGNTFIKILKLHGKWQHLNHYITDLLRPYKPSRSLPSSTKNLLMKPLLSEFNLKSYGGWSFVLALAVLWNDLPQPIKDSQSVETFKQKVKRHLFLQTYSRLSFFFRDCFKLSIFFYL